jgi:protease I
MREPILKGRRVLILADDMFEDLELTYPMLRMREEGAQVTIAGKEARTHHGKHGVPVTAEMTLEQVSTEKFDLLIIPGGYAPDHLRRYPQALEIVRQMNVAGKIVAFICHAAWVPISAGIISGKRVTCFHSIKDDVINAGGKYLDEPVVRDGNMISSRQPSDLGAFCRAILDAMEEAAREPMRKSA